MESFGFPNRRLLAWLSSGLFCLSCPQTAQSPLTLFGRELAGPNLQNRGGVWSLTRFVFYSGRFLDRLSFVFVV